MILLFGEILADMIGKEKDGIMTFEAHTGGAPFNVAVACQRAGAKTCFVGRIGNDIIGKMIENDTQKANLTQLILQKDEARNTTLAFVTLKDGERDFAFARHDTADYHIDVDNMDFSNFENLNIVHIGSLMLSEKDGQKVAEKILKKAKEVGAKTSFDINFRKDLYKDFASAVKSYKPYVDACDIIKFSDDELADYTGISNRDEAIKSMQRKDVLYIVTMGKKGSAYTYNNLSGIVTKNVYNGPLVDTTGCGDAFFGTLLAELENKTYTKENIETAMATANKIGGETTQFFGAVKL